MRERAIEEAEASAMPKALHLALPVPSWRPAVATFFTSLTFAVDVFSFLVIPSSAREVTEDSENSKSQRQ